MKKAIRNRKGVELSINMLVIVALAVFALFLIIGFVLGGFSFFRDIFGGFTERDPAEVAQIKCETALVKWKNAGSPTIVEDDRWYKQLCDARTDVDFNNDGVKDVNDEYTCDEYVAVGCP